MFIVVNTVNAQHSLYHYPTCSNISVGLAYVRTGAFNNGTILDHTRCTKMPLKFKMASATNAASRFSINKISCTFSLVSIFIDASSVRQ